jgi:hypothetical protein
MLQLKSELAVIEFLILFSSVLTVPIAWFEFGTSWLRNNIVPVLHESLGHYVDVLAAKRKYDVRVPWWRLESVWCSISRQKLWFIAICCSGLDDSDTLNLAASTATPFDFRFTHSTGWLSSSRQNFLKSY